MMRMLKRCKELGGGGGEEEKEEKVKWTTSSKTLGRLSPLYLFTVLVNLHIRMDTLMLMFSPLVFVPLVPKLVNLNFELKGEGVS